jgi:hypothetical protein
MLRRATVSTLFAAVTAAFLAFGLVGCGDNPETKDDTYTLTTSANPSAGGSITLTPSGGSYKAGDTVLLVAVPNEGYEFSSWTGATAIGTANTASVVITGNKTVTANFTKTDDGGDSTGTGGNGNELVLGENEAWVGYIVEENCEVDDEGNGICIDIELDMGFVFKTNGTVDLITYVDLEESGGPSGWFIMLTLTYSVNGNTMTLVYETGETTSGPFSISGNKLTLFDQDDPEEDITFEKTSGITYIDMDDFGGDFEMMPKSPSGKKLRKAVKKVLAATGK